MLLQVIHETLYRYQPAVEDAHHVTCLQPQAWAGQVLLHHSLDIEPAPADPPVCQNDAHGNPRCFFSLPAAHDTLKVVARSLVRTAAPTTVEQPMDWQAVRDGYLYRAGHPGAMGSEFVFASPHAPRHDGFAAYARADFAEGRPLLQACVALMERMHRELRYETHSTDVNTPAWRALEQRRGVCQDFAHIMIACLRSLGLAARYVSGYLLTEVPAGHTRLVGSDASHAWVSVYVPDLPTDDASQRWVELDPTNNRWGWPCPGEDYVRVAWGRDFSDVSPLRGVIRGGTRQTLQVGVTVQPIGDNAAPSATPHSNPS